MPHVYGFNDWLFATLPPLIAWARTPTLGYGGDRCDLCWRRVAADASLPPATEDSGGA